MRTMLQTFEFKPAPVARPVRLEVDDVGATLYAANGRVRGRLVFGEARSARLAELSARGMTSRWFDVRHAAGRFRIGCNSGTTDDPSSGHLARYRAAVDAILRGLEARAPGVEVDLGPGPGARRAMLGIGLTALAAGVALPVASLAMGVDTSEFMSSLVPAAFLVLIGVMLTAAHGPGRGSERVSPTALLGRTRFDATDSPS